MFGDYSRIYIYFLKNILSFSHQRNKIKFSKMKKINIQLSRYEYIYIYVYIFILFLIAFFLLDSIQKLCVESCKFNANCHPFFIIYYIICINTHIIFILLDIL